LDGSPFRCYNKINGIEVNGIDLICWDSNHHITDFKVMLRPLKAVNLDHQQMAAALQQHSDGA
jgi:hypothetical protein